MAPQIKLTYFHIPGRGELARLTFAVAGITFEDERVTYEQFRDLKPSLPLRNVPTLAVDGVTHVQSLAHIRYAGRLGGLYPTDVAEALKVDEIMDSLNEVYVAIVDIWTANEATKA